MFTAVLYFTPPCAVAFFGTCGGEAVGEDQIITKMIESLEILLSERAKNACLYAGLNTPELIINYYKENGDFLRLRQSGRKTNEELIHFCETYRIENELIDTKGEVNEIEEELEVITKMSFRKKHILEYLLRSTQEELSVRAQKVLDDLGGGSSERLYKKLFVHQVSLDKIHGVGKKALADLNKFKRDFKDYLTLIRTTESEDTLRYEYHNAILGRIFSSFSMTELNDIYTDTGDIKVFSLIRQLLELGYIFDEQTYIIFTNLVNYFQEDDEKKQKSYQKLGEALNISRERVRQIAKNLTTTPEKHFRFLMKLGVNVIDMYEIDIDSDIIQILESDVMNINKKEKTLFNNLFISDVVSIFCKPSHEKIRLGYLLLSDKRKKTSKLSKTYLISRDLTVVFDFYAFIMDIEERLEQRITSSYSLSFRGHILTFYTDEIDIEKLERIFTICEHILFDLFKITINDDEEINFDKNTKKTNSEYALEALEAIGEPTQVERIMEYLREKYPMVDFNSSSIRSSMSDKKVFIYISRSSTFGLKKWENTKEDVKGGTIRDIAEEYLTNSQEPKSLTEITKHIVFYRPTSNENSIYHNLKLSGRFVFFKNSYVGLKDISYDESYKETDLINRTKQSWEERIEALEQFIQSKKRLPRAKNNSPEDEVKLARFYSLNKSKYLSNKLLKNRVTTFENTCIFSIQDNPLVDTFWLTKLKAYIAFVNQYARSPRGKDVSTEEKELHYWLVNVKSLHNNGELSNVQKLLLKKYDIL